ncbi:MAG: cupin domain-containing protein [Gammaproteobacteria bacterium]|nr:cupin domain-containing protein [Gammaproteobacteria bacterium]
MTSKVLALRDQFLSALTQQTGAQARLEPFIRGLSAADFRALPQAHSGSLAPLAAEHLPAMTPALASFGALGNAVSALAPELVWHAILEGADVDEQLQRGLISSQAGAAESIPTRLGIFMLAPGLHYPLHHHAALEIYYVVYGALSIQHGCAGTPFELGAGQFSVTPCYRVHALTTGSAPCLLIYAWTGSISEPGWWWERDTDGGWRRVRWERQPDGRWLQCSSERVTAAVMREAGE